MIENENSLDNHADLLKRLERQLERGGLFTHTALSDNADRLNNAEAFLYGLVDILIEKGLLTPDELSEKAQTVRQEMQEKGEAVGPGVALRIDDPNPENNRFIPVNCEERLHICKAACCKLGFALSAPEVESGVVKWDLGQPYHIRHETDGYCSHIERDTLGCDIYHNRPGVCRKYSCANDDRIWLDFDNMVLNAEWIDEHTREGKPRLARAAMIRVQDIK